MKTTLIKIIEELEERQAFLENTDCIAESLEVEYILTIIKPKLAEECNQLIAAFNHGAFNANTSNEYDKTRSFEYFYNNIQ